MHIEIEKSGTPAGLADAMRKVSGNSVVKALLILACDENGFEPETIDEILIESSLPVIGGVFPQIVHGGKAYSKGTIVAGLMQEIDIMVVPQLSDPDMDYDEIVDTLVPEVTDLKTMLVFLDGFSKRISAFIDSLYNVFGLECNYIGGGAGSLSLIQKPCLLTKQGMIQDSALLGLTKTESGIGVRHGWFKISGPYEVTESDRNAIKTLNWMPAFDVYREVVEEHSGRQFNDENFFEIAKSYPFGISKMGSEIIVRDPLMKGEDNSLICVGEVPKHCFVDILNGNQDTLVKAASEALTEAESKLDNRSSDPTIFLVDCISRVLFLEENFKKELDVINTGKKPLIGVLSIGEIANSGQDYLEFYNKTAVIGLLEAL